MKYLAFDIETVGGDNVASYYRNKTYSAPANYKDEAKIEAYINERRLEDQRQAALYWWTGKIVCVSVKPIAQPGLGGLTVVGDDELALLTRLLDYLAADPSFTLIGKSSEYFDVPYVIGRALAHDLGIPECLRPFRGITDVDQIFGFSQAAGQRSRLSDYAFGLRIDGKLGHGSDVGTWYQQAVLGDQAAWTQIRTYCEKDVDIVCEMVRRWNKVYPRPTAGDIDADLSKAIDQTF